MSTTNALTLGRSLTSTIIRKMDKLGAVQRQFIPHILILCLSLRGRFNFLQMGREGQYNEQTYRNHFKKDFDFFEFNRLLIAQHASQNIVIAFDPSYISKSGKHTPNMGLFYSGCAGQHKRGLEIGGFAAVDIESNTAYHLIAKLSPSAKHDRINEEQTLLDHYANTLTNNALRFKEISNIIVADAYFSKAKYVDAVLNSDMNLVSRLRDDANMQYIYKGKQRGKKGRPKKYAGKVDWKNIDRRTFKLESDNDQYKMSSAIVHSVSFKRQIKVVYLELKDKKGKIKGYKLLFTTDLQMDTERVLKIYKSRFQIEFIYRDAKQYAGLEHCQARCEKKIHFHLNAVLTSINVGKIIHQKLNTTELYKPISMFDIKAELSNINFAQRLFSKYGINRYFNKNPTVLDFVRNFGKRAA